MELRHPGLSTCVLARLSSLSVVRQPRWQISSAGSLKHQPTLSRLRQRIPAGATSIPKRESSETEKSHANHTGGRAPTARTLEVLEPFLEFAAHLQVEARERGEPCKGQKRHSLSSTTEHQAGNGGEVLWGLEQATVHSDEWEGGRGGHQ